jgi:ferrous iron transport protein A
VIIAITIIYIDLGWRFMLKLGELKRGNRALVVSVNANEELRDRFSSFGLVSGVNIRMLEYTLSKKSIKIEFDNTKLALRIKEANSIEVELCD